MPLNYAHDKIIPEKTNPVMRSEDPETALADTILTNGLIRRAKAYQGHCIAALLTIRMPRRYPN